VEKMGDDPFILVTLLGPDGISSDVCFSLAVLLLISH